MWLKGVKVTILNIDIDLIIKHTNNLLLIYFMFKIVTNLPVLLLFLFNHIFHGINNQIIGDKTKW